MRRTAVVLLLIMPMAHSSAMMPKMVSTGGIARHGDHVEAHGAYAGHGLQLLDGQRPVLGGADHAGILGHGDERAREAAHGRRRHDAALLHGVVQHGERRRGARGRRTGPRRWLPGSRPRNRPRRAWGPATGPGCPAARRRRRLASRGHELAGASDLEGGGLDGLGHGT